MGFLWITSGCLESWVSTLVWEPWMLLSVSWCADLVEREVWHSLYTTVTTVSSYYWEWRLPGCLIGWNNTRGHHCSGASLLLCDTETRTPLIPWTRSPRIFCDHNRMNLRFLLYSSPQYTISYQTLPLWSLNIHKTLPLCYLSWTWCPRLSHHPHLPSSATSIQAFKATFFSHRLSRHSWCSISALIYL